MPRSGLAKGARSANRSPAICPVNTRLPFRLFASTRPGGPNSRRSEREKQLPLGLDKKNKPPMSWPRQTNKTKPKQSQAR